MNVYSELFKTNISKGIIELFKKVWRPIGLAYVLYFATSKLVGSVLVKQLGYSSSEELINEYAGLVNDMDALLEWFEGLKEIIFQPKVLVLFTLAFLVQFFIMSWLNFFGYKLARSIVTNNEHSFNAILKESFQLRLLGFIGVTIGSIVLLFASFIIAGLISGLISPFLILILFPIAFLLNLRLWLAYPTYALSNVSMGESFEISFHYINWLRAAKMLGNGFVFVFSLGIIQLILQQIVSLVGLETILGITLSNVINFVIGAITYAILISSFAALYYRYLGVEEANDELAIEDHLIDEY